jgi:hypothetical protein
MAKLRLSSRARYLLIGGIAILAAIIALIVFRDQRSGAPSTPQQADDQPVDTTAPPPGEASPPIPPPPAGAPPPTASPPAASLPAPDGQLLNKSSISLSSSLPQTSPQGMNSTCQTTVQGASCDIRLTMGATVKSLGVQKVSEQGAANFYWDAGQLGLTPGDWKVEAILSKDGAIGVSAPWTLHVDP